MGFRCPNCKQDFGTDKAAFKKHLEDEGISDNIAALAVTNLSDIVKGTDVFGAAAKEQPDA